MLAVAGLPGAAERAADGIERLFTGPLERSLDEGAGLWFDYPGLVPGRPAPPPEASHAEHLQAAMAIFDLDTDAGVLISAGLPSHMYRQVSLAGDQPVDVHVTGRDGEPPPPIAGYTESPATRAPSGQVERRRSRPPQPACSMTTSGSARATPSSSTWTRASCPRSLRGCLRA